jgi:hypothetical protein
MSNPENVNRDLIENKVVDREFLKRIIEIQDLPEEVVIKFLKAKGSLSSTNFGKQYLNEHQ